MKQNRKLFQKCGFGFSVRASEKAKQKNWFGRGAGCSPAGERGEGVQREHSELYWVDGFSSGCELFMIDFVAQIQIDQYQENMEPWVADV